MKKIRVLIVDDSILFREILKRGLSTDDNIQVIATAADPFEARDKILEFQPDVMTCDVEMPKMSGIEFLKRLLPQYPLPTIIVSSVNGIVFDALNAGAVDFVTKPDVNSVNSVEKFIYQLIEKVKMAVSAKIITPVTTNSTPNTDYHQKLSKEMIIAIGASTGGTEALTRVLKGFPKDLPGIVIVQHIPPDFSRMFAERLNSLYELSVKEAKTGDIIEPGCVLIAPGDKHMRVIKTGGKYTVECFSGDKVNGHCPSVDILFESVAKEAGSNAIGIILTGMGYDGAKGLLAMKRKGAKTIGQDEASSVVYGMPKVAYNLGAVDKQVALERVPSTIFSMLNQMGEK